MNSRSILITAICGVLISCNTPARPVVQAKETSKALQDKGSLDEIKISRGRADLIESIYKELAEKEAALNAIEGSTSSIQERSDDSLKAFSDYNQKSEEYYNAADRYTSRIKDSVLRKKIEAIINTSKTAYNKRISEFHDLINQMNAKSASLDDLLVVLKLTRTLAVIERYQGNNLPATSSLQHLLREYEQIIQKTDSLIALQ
jgi:hypothetical protein